MTDDADKRGKQDDDERDDDEVVLEDEETESESDQDEDESEAEGDDSEGQEDGESGESEEEPEFELVREGETQSQEGLEPWVQRRLKREKDRREKTGEKLSEAEERAKKAEEKLAILQMALDQRDGKKAAPKRPNAEDFNLGASDPEYLQALDEYDDARIEQKLAEREKRASKSSQNRQTEKDREHALEQSLIKHIDKAQKLGAKDFEAKEDKAIELLGDNISNYIIMNSDKSHLLMYYLGTNEKEALALKAKIEANPPRGAILIGELAAQLKPKSKTKNSKTRVPDPDEEVEGGTKAHKKVYQGPEGATFV